MQQTMLSPAYWYQHIGRSTLGRQLVTIAFIILGTLLFSPSAHAVNGTWSSDGNSITFNNKTYTRESAVLSGNDGRGHAGQIAYTHFDGSSGVYSTIFIANTNDPQSSTDGEEVQYKKNGASYTQTGGLGSVTLEKSGGGLSSGKGNCNGSFTAGVGWMICPVMNWMAKIVDGLWNVINNFLEVRAFTSSDEELYKVWDVARQLANALFAVVFIFIVYAQITSTAMNAYSIRIILPRMIAGAIFVNISFWICAIGVDASNIAGYSVKAIFEGIASESNVSAMVDIWTRVTAYLLAGGAGILTVAGTAIFVAPELLASLAFSLLAGLIGVLFSALVAFIVLSARQALITVMVVIAPLAFIAFILPNTRALYEKWQKGFVTLLVFFPLFGALFGGSQLAGRVIINSAGGNIALIIMGLVVQGVPLVLTPFVLKFSSGLLGQIANIVNNTKSGPLDRLKNIATDRADYHKTRALGRDNVRPYDWMTTLAQRNDRRKRKRDSLRSSAEMAAETRYMRHRDGQAADRLQRQNQTQNEMAKQALEKNWEQIQSSSPHYISLRLQAEASRQSLDEAKKETEKMVKEVVAQGATQESVDTINRAQRAGINTGMTEQQMRTLNTAASQLKMSSENASLINMATGQAEKKFNSNVADRILDNQTTQDYASSMDGVAGNEYVDQEKLVIPSTATIQSQVMAGGIAGTKGQHSAVAKAQATKNSDYMSAYDDMTKLADHFGVSNEDLMGLVRDGKNITKTKDGRSFTFEDSNEFAMHMGIERLVKTGTVKEREVILNNLGEQKYEEYQSVITDTIETAGHGAKTIYMGGALSEFIKRGKIKTEEDLDNFIRFNISNGKFSADQIASLDPDALKRIDRVMNQEVDIDKVANIVDKSYEYNDDGTKRSEAEEAAARQKDIDTYNQEVASFKELAKKAYKSDRTNLNMNKKTRQFIYEKYVEGNP